jgi:hypothetical protein
VIADPNPTTVWTHIDVKGRAREIKRTTDKFNGNYTIYNARVNDSGTYFCNTSNALGKDFYSTKIKIKPGLLLWFYFKQGGFIIGGQPHEAPPCPLAERENFEHLGTLELALEFSWLFWVYK